jgi:hypothetical protein
MLQEPMMEKLTAMRLLGMTDALKAQEQDPASRELSFLERLGLAAAPTAPPSTRAMTSLPRCRSGSRRIPLRHAAMPQYIKPVVRGRIAISSGTISNQDSCQRNFRIARKPALP